VLASLSSICNLLAYRGRSDLASLLTDASIQFNESDTYGSFYCCRLTTAEICAPIADYDRLRALTEEDQKVILDAFLEIWPPEPYGREIANVTYRLDQASLQEHENPHAQLLQEIERERDLMIAVATGGPRINSVRRRYTRRHERIDAMLRRLDIQNPNPYRDLWDWYGKWSSGDLPSYQSRRDYVRGLFAPLERFLREGHPARGAEVFAGPTGWPRVDRALGEIRKRLEEASSEEQFQAVGLLCRETLISLAQTVYVPQRHPIADGTSPSATDAKRMLDAYLAVELSGGQNEAARRHAKASLDFANALLHKRTASFREAALCAEATASVINIIAIVSGRRDPENVAHS
jgi:hypothetical protein